jgi:septum site-determining protein MinC
VLKGKTTKNLQGLIKETAKVRCKEQMVQKQLRKQNVLIKGTKDGLTFILNDQCSFDSLLTELNDKLSDRPPSSDSEEGQVRIKLVSGKRYLDPQQLDALKEALLNHINGVEMTVESEVMSKEEAEKAIQSQEVNRLLRIVRSGQVIEVTGDLLLIGDVNPGGTIKASGNIFVIGKMRGIAHAGCEGNRQAVICGSSMLPSQLRIADVISRPPEEESDKELIMECAFVDETGEMVIDKVQHLQKIRPEIASMM